MCIFPLFTALVIIPYGLLQRLPFGRSLYHKVDVYNYLVIIYQLRRDHTVVSKLVRTVDFDEVHINLEISL